MVDIEAHLWCSHPNALLVSFWKDPATRQVLAFVLFFHVHVHVHLRAHVRVLRVRAGEVAVSLDKAKKIAMVLGMGWRTEDT
jgi:hypothetical protein